MSDLNSIVPKSIDNTIVDFCSMVSPGQMPFYVPVLPEEFSRESYCFPNVAEKIARDGGSIVYGWKIWLFPGLFVEGELHSVWQSKEGTCIDITKDESNEKILFLPDTKIEYHGARVDNIRKNISNNKLVDQYIGIAECLYLIGNHGDRAYKQHITYRGDDLRFMQYFSTLGFVLLQMLVEGIGRGAPCPCDSGKKYKACCEVSLLEHIAIAKKIYRNK